MSYLIAVTLLWAFSFSLIGIYLAGQVDAYFAVLMRVVMALMLFLPFLRPQPVSLVLKLLALGAVQLGLMWRFLGAPRERATWYSALGINFFVLGMLVSAFALRATTGQTG